MLLQRRLGDRQVSAVGLGCMPLSSGQMVSERAQAIATIHAALDAGITLLDTANIYAPSWDTVGHNEALVAEALRTYTGAANLSDVVVATKGGITRSDGEQWGRNARADAMLRAAEASARELGVASIELYQFHRHDPSMTYADHVRSLAGVREAGLARLLGLSNVTLAELDLALEMLGGPEDGGIVSVQNEFSPRFRAEADVLHRCTDLGIAFLPWSPLGGAAQAHDIGSRYAAFAEVGAELGATAQEVVLAWHRQMSPVVIAIPGATRPSTVASIVRSLEVQLSDEQFARLQATQPEAKSMYPEDLPRSPLR